MFYLLKVDNTISSDTVCKLSLWHLILYCWQTAVGWNGYGWQKNAQVLALNLDENLGILCGMRLPHLPGVLELGIRPGIMHYCKINAAVGLHVYNYCSCIWHAWCHTPTPQMGTPPVENLGWEWSWACNMDTWSLVPMPSVSQFS